jgi:serine protease AprX
MYQATPCALLVAFNRPEGTQDVQARSLKWAATIGFVAAGLAAPVALAQEDPANVVYSAEFENGKIVKAGQSPLGKESFGRAELKQKDVKEDRLPPEGKIQPALLDLLASGDPHKPVEIVVNYRDPLTIPTFPMPVLDEDRESPRNKEILGQIQGMIGDIKARRADLYKQQSAQLEQLGGKVLNTYWLIQGTHVSLPLEAVKRLSADDQVTYLELADGVEKPPADANPDNDLIDARAQIFSDPYFNLGQTNGWIGLLDTGVRTTHVAFNSPDHIAIAQDLTGDGDPSDQCDHGTASAGEITGNARLGNNWRGVSAISVDSWDVYGDDCSVGSAHTVAGFEAAVSWADRVIVAEIQLNAGEASASSTAADAAFDAGSVVIAANGNFGPGAGTVRSPGNAHKAIGIGAADLQTDALMNYSGRGPSADGRYKPDLVFPTNIEAPRASSNTALGSFGGTSAATPVAGGAAGLLRNWMRGGVGSIDAGHVYSHMILGGQTAYPFNNNTGAGPFQLGTGGHAYWGKTNVTNGARVDIPISIPAGKTKFEGSLWWPEATSGHNDVDLELIAPDGSVRDTSISISSVFERATVSSGVYAGTWKLRIKGYSVSGTQKTFWSARTR